MDHDDVLAHVRDYVPGLEATIGPSARGILLWCRIGRAHVSVGGGRFAIRERDAVWIPPGFAVTIGSAPGTVVVPIAVHRRTSEKAAGEPLAVVVPARWQPVLLTAYARSLGFLHEDDDAPDLVAPLVPAGRASQLETPHPADPSMRAIAEAVAARPRASTSVQEHAATLGCTVRTFERRFRAETGLTFRDWRRRARVRAGLRAIAEGCAVAEASEVAGFDAASAFCRSVRELTGLTPLLAAHRADPAPPEEPDAPPPLPAARTVARATPFEVVLWAARGSGVVVVDGVAHRLHTACLAVLPAHRPHRIVVDPDSVLLPVASRALRGRRASRGIRLVATPARLRAVLLHSSVVSYTPLRSPGFEPAGLFDALGDGARARGVVDLGRSAARVTRLTHGARLLREGHSVADTAQILGYAHPSAFGRAFRAHYGMPPSRFRDQAVRGPASTTIPWMLPEPRPTPRR